MRSCLSSWRTRGPQRDRKGPGVHQPRPSDKGACRRRSGSPTSLLLPLLHLEGPLLLDQRVVRQVLYPGRELGLVGGPPLELSGRVQGGRIGARVVGDRRRDRSAVQLRQREGAIVDAAVLQVLVEGGRNVGARRDLAAGRAEAGYEGR